MAGRLEKDREIKLHHETIYQFIPDDKRNEGTLYKHLRHQKKTYRKGMVRPTTEPVYPTGLVLSGYSFPDTQVRVISKLFDERPEKHFPFFKPITIHPYSTDLHQDVWGTAALKIPTVSS